jgi:hypothetical protein
MLTFYRPAPCLGQQSSLLLQCAPAWKEEPDNDTASSLLSPSPPLCAPASLSRHIIRIRRTKRDRIVDVQGVLEAFEWVAPHSLLKVKDDEGRLYIFEWQAPLSLQRRGIQEDTLKKGDRLVVTGNPHRGFDENRILNFKSVKRPADGWKWPSW